MNQLERVEFWDLETLFSIQMKDGLNTISEAIADWGKDKGFSGPLNFAQKIALCHSELSEALEADRTDERDKHLPRYEGRAVEMADTMIRLLHLAALIEAPIGDILFAKMAVNEERPFKHGKKY